MHLILSTHRFVNLFHSSVMKTMCYEKAVTITGPQPSGFPMMSFFWSCMHKAVLILRPIFIRVDSLCHFSHHSGVLWALRCLKSHEIYCLIDVVSHTHWKQYMLKWSAMQDIDLGFLFLQNASIKTYIGLYDYMCTFSYTFLKFLMWIRSGDYA